MITTTMALGVGISIGIAKERFHQARELKLDRGDGARHIVAGFTREVNAISSRIANITGNKKKKVVTIKVVKGSKSKKKGKGKKGTEVVVVDEAGTLICTT